MVRLLVFKEDFYFHFGLRFIGYVSDDSIEAGFNITVCSDCALLFSSYDDAYDFSLKCPDEYLYLEQFVEV